MTEQNTEKSLGIFWDGEEVDGVTIYGLFAGAKSEEPIAPSGVWPENCDFKINKLSGDDWTVWLWDVRINEWPKKTEWFNTIKRTLETMIHQGASVAWCGLEGFFVEPPDLFKPEFMGGGIWAAYTIDGDFICKAQIGEIFETLDDSILKKIRNKIEPQ